MKTYTAPWGTSLVVMSWLATLLCVGVAGGLALSGGGAGSGTLAPVALLVVGALFTVRGYTVTPEAVLVRRLFWTTRLPLAELRSARYEPDAMRGSIRTFGNGGLFSYTGYFRNGGLGSYRAFVTDRHQTVVLRFTSRTVVVSPSTPEEFVRDIAEMRHAA